MPEVCEVALTAEILEKYTKNKVLEKIKFVAGRYGPDRTPPVGFTDIKKLLPAIVTKVDSRGKFLWFELNGDGTVFYIWNTFGLTGMWSFYKPKYLKAIMTFSDGTIAYFSDVRNFGTFKFSTSKNQLEKKLQELSPDFLKDDDFDLSEIKKIRKPIVTILMNQKLIGSGIGNYLSAEILYRAKISPYRLGTSLSSSDLSNLKYWIKYMVKLCYVDNHIGYMINLEDEANKIKRKNYHPEIKLKDKEFDFQVYKQSEDPLGNKVERDEIIKGRTTYWVPAVQK